MTKGEYRVQLDMCRKCKWFYEETGPYAVHFCHWPRHPSHLPMIAYQASDCNEFELMKGNANCADRRIIIRIRGNDEG